MIKNLVNFKNEVFGVPFSEHSACSMTTQQNNYSGGIMSQNDPRLRPDYLKFGVGDGHLSKFEETYH